MEPYVFQEAPENVLKEIIRHCGLMTINALGSTTSRLRSISKDFIKTGMDAEYRNAHRKELDKFYWGLLKYRNWKKVKEYIPDEMEGNSKDQMCQECKESKADYRILKWRIVVQEIDTNRLHSDQGPPGIRYVCTECLVKLGYTHDDRM